MAAAAAAAAVVREAAASAVMDVLDAGESEEEKSSKLAAAKEDKMRKVIRYEDNDTLLRAVFLREQTSFLYTKTSLHFAIFTVFTRLWDAA